jgi:OOP family OmpA-OmpF porin
MLTISRINERINGRVKGFIAIGLICGLSACASNVKKAEISQTADPTSEIEKLDADIATASSQQVNVTAPKNFHEAEVYRDKAKRQRTSGDAQSKVLDSVAQSRGFLNEANNRATATNEVLANVLKARQDARNAEAEKYNGPAMANLDGELKDVAEDVEKGSNSVSESKKTKLQARYLDLELMSIKTAQLSHAKNVIETAEKDGAKRYAPKTLIQARDQYKAAVTVITNERHNTSQIATATEKANMTADRLLKITHDAKGTKGSSPEDVALRIENQEKNQTAAVNSKDKVIADKEATLAATNQQLSETQDEVAARNKAVEDEKAAAAQERDKNGELIAANAGLSSEMQKKDKFNKSFEDARKSFTPEEADVSRQGDNLIIRLKTLNFPSGHSDLSGESFSVLNKVKDVLATMNAEKVMVEGHTDSVGGKSTNQKLSEDRAKTVANYLVSTDVIAKNQVASAGYGYEKPLASNKTKEGRMQNRRVDLIITPQAMDQSTRQ